MRTKNWQIPSFKTREIRKKKKPYCLCVPVINEGERFKTQLTQMKKKRIDEMVDIIICDGGSSDGSTDLSFLRKQGVSTLLTKTGGGKLSAQLRMGYSYALRQGCQGVVTIDGNNKDNIAAIPNFINELKKGFDFIQGSRYIRGGKAINIPLLRTLAIKLIHVPVVSLLAGFKYTDTTNGYRAYSRKFLLDKDVGPFRNIFDSYELLAYLSVKAPQLGYRVKEIPVTRAYPKAGKIPTKIGGFKGNFKLLIILWNLLLNKYGVENKKD